MIARVAVAALALTACGTSGAPPRRSFDATLHVAPLQPAAAVVDNGVGAIDVQVAWLAAPSAMRDSTVRLSCGAAKPARAAIGTMGGVASAVVIVERAGAVAPQHGAPMSLRLIGCSLTPRVLAQPANPDGALIVESDSQARRAVHLDRVADDLAHATTDAAGANVVVLPWAGAAVRLPLTSAQVVRVSTDDDRDVASWVVTTTSPWVAVTDDAGAASFSALPPGHYDVTAWLPPAAGAPAKLAHGAVDVVAKATASISLDLATGTASSIHGEAP